uniref:Uncharacterized protein n=1 Tax=Rangifer tarandus platyrhynchus TaxID=3082113 RepID=A0ACB0E3V0_RANTA|nr:unnamed protein product [Rangifer tarandus platyrhynchus]
MPGVVSYAKGGVRQRSRESRPARAGEEGEESRDPRLQTSVRCAPPRKEGTVPTGVSGLLTGGRPTLSLVPGVGEPVLKSLLPPREEEEGFSPSSFTGAASSLLGMASGFNLDRRPGLSGDRKHR